MSNGFLSGMTSLWDSDLPRWACEFRVDAVSVVHASVDRKQAISHASVSFPEGTILPGLKAPNITDSLPVQNALKRALDESGFSGSDLIVVVPDDAVQISLIETESFPSTAPEQDSFIRWKLRKNVPFDVAEAKVDHMKLGESGVVHILAVLSPATVTDQYEGVVDGLGLRPGVVSPSTLSALNLLNIDRPAADVLFVKVSRVSVVTSILRNGMLRFYRKAVRPDSLEQAVYPTLMYYKDKLAMASNGGLPSGFSEMILCSEIDEDLRAVTPKLGLAARPLYSAGLEDIYKPALGALQR